MSPISVHRNDAEGNRLYTWTGAGKVEEFYSVTTINGRAFPPYLVAWAAKLVAELAYDDLTAKVGTLGRRRGAGVTRQWAREGRELVRQARLGGAKLKDIDETDRGMALRYLKHEPDRVRDEAAETGIKVHDAAEDVALRFAKEATRLILAGEDLPVWPERIRPWMDNAFLPWVAAYRPKIIAAECTVFNRQYVYAGTADLFAEVYVDLRDGRGPRWVIACIDYKSGKGIYPEVALQLAAYARGEFIGSPDLVTELEVPKAEITAVLHLTPKGFKFRRARYDDKVFGHFLYARESFRWIIDTSLTALGDELTPDLEDALTASLEAIR